MIDGRPSGDVERLKRRVEDLETLLRAGELLDPSLDRERLLHLALELALRVVRADAAFLVAQGGGESGARALARGDAAPRRLDVLESRLAAEVLATGHGGIRRDPDTPGARAAAEVLGRPPAVRIAAPLARLDRVLGALEVAYCEDPGSGLEDEEAALRSVADHLAIALDTARLVRDQGRRTRELSLLVGIGTKISAHLDLDELLDAIVDAIRELVPANAVGIFLIGKGGTIHKESLRDYDPARVDAARLQVGRGILGAVAVSGEGIIVPDVREDPRYVPARDTTRSEMAAPLKYEGRVIGVFNVESDRKNAFRPSDLALLTSFADQAAISITNARLHSVASAKRRLDEQLRVARDIQSSLLPQQAPNVPGHALAGKNVPSSVVGGDYFDFVALPGGRWAIVVGDVSGNGIPAALIMASFRAGVRAELRLADDPRVVFERVNRVLCAELDPDRFVTAFLGVYTPETGSLVYSSAGHEPGLLVRASGGVERLTDGGLLLGVFPEAFYVGGRVRLEPGDRLLLYTDGLSDAAGEGDEPLGEKGVVRLLGAAEAAGAAPTDLPRVMLSRLPDRAAPPAAEVDDRTLVVLERLPGGAPAA
ncbi:MAG: SpoIIE family protein phosphatase [bacterium]